MKMLRVQLTNGYKWEHWVSGVCTANVEIVNGDNLSSGVPIDPNDSRWRDYEVHAYERTDTGTILRVALRGPTQWHVMDQYNLKT